MKRKLLSILGIGLLVCAVSTVEARQAQQPPSSPQAQPPAEKTDFSKIFKDDQEKNSYAIGLSYGMGIKANLKRTAPDMEFSSDAILRGFKDGLSGDKTLITEAEGRQILSELTKGIAGQDRGQTAGGRRTE